MSKFHIIVHQFFFLHIIMFVCVNIIQRKLRGASQVPTNPVGEFDLLINYFHTHPLRSVTPSPRSECTKTQPVFPIAKIGLTLRSFWLR